MESIHVGHQVRGRYRGAEQIEYAVARLQRGDFLILECGTEDCYAQVRLTEQGTYEVEYRDGAPGEHYQTTTLAQEKTAATLTAWAAAEAGWNDPFDWTCVGSWFTTTGEEPVSAPLGISVPMGRPVGGAKGNGRATVFHISTQSDWEAAQATGEYRISTRGARLEDIGFIHACFADQVESIANSIFALATEPLIVLPVDEGKLPAPVRVEPVPGAALFFPHIYGPLPVNAVTNHISLSRDPRTDEWRWPFAQAWKQPVPARIPIAWEEDYRTKLIGRYDDGLFLVGFAGITHLHLFDAHGAHRASWIGPAEHALGESGSAMAAMEYMREVVDALPGREFGDIAIEPFAVEHTDGKRYGLFDETVDHGAPHVELRPDFLGFNPPWDGLYDT